MKKRGTKGVREDRLSGTMPDPSHLSNVSRSALVRAGSRWLAFAHNLSLGPRRRMSAADPRAFIEALYGKKFNAFEGGAFSFDKVYRTKGDGLSVSETRLSVGLHPRFDLRVFNFYSYGGAQVFREKTTTEPLPHTGSNGREPGDARGVGRNVFVNTASPTFRTLNVSRSPLVSHQLAFNYVNIRERRPRQGRMFKSPRTNAAAATTPASLHQTIIELPRAFIHEPRRESINNIFNKYLPAQVTREFLDTHLSSASVSEVTTRDVTVRRSTSAPVTLGSWTTNWTYAGLSARRAPGRIAEIHREFRSTETLRGRSPLTHAPSRAARPALLHVLPPESLLVRFVGTRVPVLLVNAGGAAHTTYNSGGGVHTSSLRYVRAHPAQTVAREATAGTHAPRLHAQTLRPTPTFTWAEPSTLNLFIEHVHTSVKDLKHGGRTKLFAQQGSRSLSHRGFEFVSARLSGASSDAASRRTKAQGAGAFLFTKRLLLRTTGAQSPTAATALRLADATAESGHPSWEPRAARPEGMALELVRRRREQVLQPTPHGYVFTQTPRAQLEERRVITRASREEIVEVVRREVRSLASNAPTPSTPTRADIAGLAEEVYATLARRLLVEKERLGRL